jgi:hypothetical protein
MKPRHPSEGPSLFDEPHARARSTDPGTSHAAARSISPTKIRESQAFVLGLLVHYGPMTDAGLLGYAELSRPRVSPSGIRTRRSELVTQGLVGDTGRRVRLETGRHAIVWGAL